jgi:hypothetical protein
MGFGGNELLYGLCGEAVLDCWLSHPSARPLASIKARDFWRELADFQTFVRGVFGGDMMAVKKQKRVYNTQWINVSLSDHDAEQLASEEVTDEQVFADVLALVVQGFEVRIKQRDGNESYIAMLFPVSANHPFDGLALSAYAPTPNVALRALLYKHFRILQEDWSSYLHRSGGGIG